VFLPWDRDHSLWQVDLSIFQRVNGNLLLANALANPDLRALFLQTIERCAAAALQDGWLEAEVSRLAAQVASAAPFDTRLPYTEEAHNEDLAQLIDFARRRSEFARTEVARARLEGSRR
jgi:hypothetical protein